MVTAGAWTAPLLGPTFDRLLVVNRQVLHWFPVDDASAYGSDAPVLIWMHGAGDNEYFYGFPPQHGRVKVATEYHSPRSTADTIDRSVGPGESRAMYAQHVEGRLAGTSAEAADAAVCLYTITPDRGFIIDRHPDSDRIFVVSACSGHGFKHSAGIGEVVAEVMATGSSCVDISPFALSRFQ